MSPGTAKFRCVEAGGATTDMVTAIAMVPTIHPATGPADAAVLGVVAAGVVSLGPAICA